jgi:hypothetical protein
VKLSGVNSTDPTGSPQGITSYEWTQVDGPAVVLSDLFAPEPTFAAPELDTGDKSLSFLLTVTDKGGSESLDACLVNVTRGNAPPTAHAGPNQSAASGSLVTLDGSGSTDEDDGIVSYGWTQLSGKPIAISGPCAAVTTFVTPEVVNAQEQFVFQLSVKDAGGLEDTDRVTITVTPATH